MPSFSYRCPNCSRDFSYSPNDEREGGHCGHECLGLGCHTMMIWDDDPGMNGQPQNCRHRALSKPGSVLPVKVS